MNNHIPWITPTEAKEKVSNGALLIDVRTPKETNDGYLTGALLINSEEALDRLSEFGSNKEREIVLYCKSGGRSNAVAVMLESKGYKKLFNAGGYEDLKGEW